MCVCVCICMNICMYMCVYIYIYIYIHDYIRLPQVQCEIIEGHEGKRIIVVIFLLLDIINIFLPHFS